MTQIPSPISIPSAPQQRRAGAGENILLSLAGAAPQLLTFFLDRQAQGRDRQQQEQSSMALLQGMLAEGSDALTDPGVQAIAQTAGVQFDQQPAPTQATGAQFSPALGALPQAIPAPPPTADFSNVQGPAAGAATSAIQELFNQRLTSQQLQSAQTSERLATEEGARAVGLHGPALALANTQAANAVVIAKQTRFEADHQEELFDANLAEIKARTRASYLSGKAATVRSVNETFDLMVGAPLRQLRSEYTTFLGDPAAAERLANLLSFPQFAGEQPDFAEVQSEMFNAMLNDQALDPFEALSQVMSGDPTSNETLAQQLAVGVLRYETTTLDSIRGIIDQTLATNGTLQEAFERSMDSMLAVPQANFDLDRSGELDRDERDVLRRSLGLFFKTRHPEFTFKDTSLAPGAGLKLFRSLFTFENLLRLGTGSPMIPTLPGDTPPTEPVLGTPDTSGSLLFDPTIFNP